jgi:putative sigma-54 modulation protein
MLDLLLPRRCAVCSERGTDLCACCRAALPRLRGPLCERCGAPVAWPVRRCLECARRRLAFASARAAVAYDGAVRALVAAWKEHGLRQLAGLAAELVTEVVPRPAVDVLAPVPTDAERARTRGYRPVAALADELGRLWDLPVEPLLARPRAGPRQRGLALAARRRNVRGAFVTTACPPRRVAVVDDVYTSGSTVAAAAGALRASGTRHVHAVTFARAVRGYIPAQARPPPDRDEGSVMRLQVRGKNLEVSDSIRSYAEDKLRKLDPQLHELTQVELELRVERNPSIAANQIAEATIWTKGPVLRAREASGDMRASIDQLTEKLLRQVKSYRDRRTRRWTRGNGVPSGGAPVASEESEPQIVKTKQFAVKPMTPEEAVLQLELIGHDFFVFVNADTGEVNVVYRRKDGGYGLIEPQLA